MKNLMGLLAVFAMTIGVSAVAAEKDAPAALAFKMKSLQGKEVDLASYKGKVRPGGQCRQRVRTDSPI